jgi:hypothetical protein
MFAAKVSFLILKIKKIAVEIIKSAKALQKITFKSIAGIDSDMLWAISMPC